jgi:UDP-GlcNAc:undecaprenyl-phosphate/decaprenyl-phosphate GlcNAc-1-phosphate transferase
MIEYFFLIPVIISFLLTLSLVPSVIKIGQKHQWVDKPDHRKHHQKAVVRVGGIAIMIGVSTAAIASIVIGSMLGQDTLSSGTFAIVLGSIGFFAIGFADDVLQLPPLPRLIAQILLASLVWSLGVRIEYLPIPFLGATSTGILSLPITIIWIAGIANAINWLDGLDGLAAGVGTLSAIILAITAGFQGQYESTYLALALGGSTLGFLIFNLPPAKLYMGDGGSYLIGFTLAGISALGLMDTQTMTSTLAPLLILGVPVVDMILVMASRIARGKSPLYPDRRHLHHRLLNAGCSKMFSTGYIWALSSWVASLAVLISNPAWGGICFSSLSIIFFVMSIMLSSKSKEKQREASYQS